jgi:hypothetical protein
MTECAYCTRPFETGNVINPPMCWAHLDIALLASQLMPCMGLQPGLVNFTWLAVAPTTSKLVLRPVPDFRSMLSSRVKIFLTT